MEENIMLPSEVARLVLGYLKESNCELCYKNFLETSQDLRECLSFFKFWKCIPTKYLGKSLKEILEEYTQIYFLVKEHIKKLESDRQNADSLPLVLPITATLVDRIRVLINASTTGQTMLLSITLPANSNNSYSNKAKLRNLSAKSEKSANRSKHSVSKTDPHNASNKDDMEVTQLENLPGHYSDNYGCSVDESDLDAHTPVKRKSSTGSHRGVSGNNLKEVNDEINGSVKVEMFAKGIMENLELQEKIAENINLIRNTPNEPVSENVSVLEPKQIENEPNYENLNPASVLDNELDIIKSIVDRTERDPVFEKFIEEIVGPVIDATSDENMYSSCSVTSTPQRSRSIPRTQYNTRRKYISNARSLSDTRKGMKNRIPLRLRLRNTKFKNSDLSPPKSDVKQTNSKSIEDHNAAAIQSIINAANLKTNDNVTVQEKSEERLSTQEQTHVSQQVCTQSTTGTQQVVVSNTENLKFKVSTSNVENITEPTVPNTTSGGDVILFEGSLDKYLQSSNILPSTYSTQPIAHTAPQKQLTSTNLVLQQPTNLLVQQPGGSYVVLNSNIMTNQQPFVISTDSITTTPIHTDPGSQFYIVQNPATLNFPNTNLLNFGITPQPKIEIAIPKPQPVIKCQSVTKSKPVEVKSSTINTQEILNMPTVIMCEQEPTVLSGDIKQNETNLTSNSKHVETSMSTAEVSYNNGDLTNSDNNICLLKQTLGSTKNQQTEHTDLNIRILDVQNVSESITTDSVVKESDSKVAMKHSCTEKTSPEKFTPNENKTQIKRRIVPMLISTQTETINKAFCQDNGQDRITLYSTNNVMERVVVDGNKNTVDLSENASENVSEKDDSQKINMTSKTGKQMTPEDIIRASVDIRKTQSTPRSGGRSHVRALDFSTPLKTSEKKKSFTSPKVASSRNTDIDNVQCRAKLFDKDTEKNRTNEIVPVISNIKITDVPIATRSPMEKLTADWDKVQGVGLIFGTENSPNKLGGETNAKIKRKRSFSESDTHRSADKNIRSNKEIKLPKKKHDITSVELKTDKTSGPLWDADLRALVTVSPPKKKVKRISVKKIEEHTGDESKKSKRRQSNTLNTSEDKSEDSSPVTRRITRSCSSPKRNITLKGSSSPKTSAEIVKKKITKKVIIKPRTTKSKKASPDCITEIVESEIGKTEVESVIKIEVEKNIRVKKSPAKVRKKCNKKNIPVDAMKEIIPIITFDKSIMNINIEDNHVQPETVQESVAVLEKVNESPESISDLSKNDQKDILDVPNLSGDTKPDIFIKLLNTCEKSSVELEKTQKSQKSSSIDTRVTPDLAKQLTNFPITSVHNLIPLLETPVKEDFSGIPITPRFLSPFSMIDTPITKLINEQVSIMNETIMPTPEFPPMTPNVIITPKLPGSESPSAYFNRPTDYSTCSSSYYQPSDSDQNALESMLISECAKYERKIEIMHDKQKTKHDRIERFDDKNKDIEQKKDNLDIEETKNIDSKNEGDKHISSQNNISSETKQLGISSPQYILHEISLPERKFAKELDKTKYDCVNEFEDENARDASLNCDEDPKTVESRPRLITKIKKCGDLLTVKTASNSSTSSCSSSSSSSSSLNNSTSDSSFVLSEENNTVIKKDLSIEESNISRYPLRNKIRNSKDDELPNDKNKLVQSEINIEKSSKDDEEKSSCSSPLNIQINVPEPSVDKSASNNEATDRDIVADGKLFRQLEEKRMRIIEKLKMGNEKKVRIQKKRVKKTPLKPKSECLPKVQEKELKSEQCITVESISIPKKESESDSESIALVKHLKERGILLVPNKKNRNKNSSSSSEHIEDKTQISDVKHLTDEKVIKTLEKTSKCSKQNEVTNSETYTESHDNNTISVVVVPETNVTETNAIQNPCDKIQPDKNSTVDKDNICLLNKIENVETSVSGKNKNEEIIYENTLHPKNTTKSSTESTESNVLELPKTDRFQCVSNTSYNSYVYDETKIETPHTNTLIDMSKLEIELEMYDDELKRDILHTIKATPLMNILDIPPKQNEPKDVSKKYKNSKGTEKMSKPKRFERRKSVIKLNTDDVFHSETSNEKICPGNEKKTSRKKLHSESKIDEKIKSTSKKSTKKQTPLDILCAELSDNTNDTSFDGFDQDICKVSSSELIYPSKEETKKRAEIDDRISGTSEMSARNKTCNREEIRVKSKPKLMPHKNYRKIQCKSRVSDYDRSEARRNYVDGDKTDTKEKDKVDSRYIDQRVTCKPDDIVQKLNESLEEGEWSHDEDTDSLMTLAVTASTREPASSVKRKASRSPADKFDKRARQSDPQTLLKKLDLDSFLRKVHGPDD